MIRTLRHIGIAIGSIVIAWLAVSLVAGAVLGPNASGNVLIVLITLVLGGLIYQDIVRRERRPA
jgi:uncharacterized membrane protein